MEWLRHTCRQPDSSQYAAAQQRQTQLTKPVGALGELETIAVRLASLQARANPQLTNIHISVFAADHGVAEEGVSAFPQAVTQQMVQNFLNGGAAISVLARELGATLEVVDVGVKLADGQYFDHPQLISHRAGNGTANSAQTAAMSDAALAIALQAGYAAAERAKAKHADLFIGGEMGIANTTAATALYCALLGIAPDAMTGAGTGLDAHGIQHKSQVIAKMLQLHPDATPLVALRCLGGFEIAALSGAYIRAAQLGIPSLIDGFISTSAALLAMRVNPSLSDWLFFAHTSAEAGHAYALQTLQHRPLLALGLRLGEGSGAAVAVPLLRLACALHNNMATFAEAAVAGKL